MTTGNERAGQEFGDRRMEFRRLMVATVDASVPVPRQGKVVIVTIAAALFLVGILTGGALVASSSGLTSASRPWWVSPTARDAVLQGISGGELTGTSKVATHTGTLLIELGVQPKGANVLAVSIPCQQQGRGNILVDGGHTARSTYRCKAANGSVSELYTVARAASHRLTVTASSGTALVITWSWATSAESSELFKLQQQELRGELTQTEQAYDEGVAECAAGALSGIACPAVPSSPTP
jgi:hypothetical protein